LDHPVRPPENAITYSVIQRSLEQKITRAQLEEASTHVPTIARTDCVRIHKLLAGIFISRISHQEALAFQRGLAAQGHEADVVEDAQIPPLPPGMRSMRVSRVDRELHFRDFMDRPTVIPLDEILFVAGGCIEDSRLKRHTHITYVHTGRGGRMPVEESHLRQHAERSARIDIFFTRHPYRFSLSAGEATRFFVQDQPIHLRNSELIAWAFQKVRGWLPVTSRHNSLIHLDQPLSRRVPMSVYEEEIRWRFHRLRNA